MHKKRKIILQIWGFFISILLFLFLLLLLLKLPKLSKNPKHKSKENQTEKLKQTQSQNQYVIKCIYDLKCMADVLSLVDRLNNFKTLKNRKIEEQKKLNQKSKSINESFLETGKLIKSPEYEYNPGTLSLNTSNNYNNEALFKALGVVALGAAATFGGAVLLAPAISSLSSSLLSLSPLILI